MADQDRKCRARDFCRGGTIASDGKSEWHRSGGLRNRDRDRGAEKELAWRAHRSVLRAVAGAHADAQDGSGESFQLTAWWCDGQAARAVTGVDADDEHHEYRGHRTGQKRGDDEQDDGGSH
jgi:hypothetical protein